MTPQCLLTMAEECVARGGKMLVLQVPRKRAPGENASLLPGLRGRLVGYERGRATIMVAASDVVAWFGRRPNYIADYERHVSASGPEGRASSEETTNG